MQVAITDAAIGRARRDAANDGQRRELADTGERGLRLRVTPAGAATWVLGCRDRQGKARRFPLGSYPSVGLKAAREAARALRHKVRIEGADPIATQRRERAVAKEAAAGVGTLSALLTHYGTVRGVQLRSWPDCQRQIRNVFKRHLDLAMASLTAADLQATADRHPSQQAGAAAVRYLRPVIRWAAKRGMASAGLAALDPPAKVTQRDRVLTDAELAAIWRATEAPGIPATFGKLVRLLILLGQRRDEVAAMAWPELSPDRKEWTIPTARAKNATAHSVPLSEAARAMLPPVAGAGLIFPGKRATAFGGWSKAKDALDAASGVTGWRIHDIRRTVATGLQRLGVRLEVTEAVLGHVSGSRAGVVGIYQRHDWADEKRAALDLWAAHVAAIVCNG
jgi:integrase